MELGVRGLGSAPPDCCVIWVGPLPSLGLGFLESTCHLQVGSAQHIPLWRADSVQLSLDGVNFHPVPTLGQPLHLLRGLVGVAGS